MLSSASLQRNRQEIKTTPIHIHNVSKQHIFLNKGALMIKHSTRKEEYNIKNCPFMWEKGVTTTKIKQTAALVKWSYVIKNINIIEY